MKMILFSGLPGTGKSALAESLGADLGIPVFAKDWLEAVLLRNGLKQTLADKPFGFVGYELLSVLAERQLTLKQSVILDSVASPLAVRIRWRQLADQYKANWRVIECICSDEALHHARLSQRQRSIPGRHELK
jgi:predicted kinase